MSIEKRIERLEEAMAAVTAPEHVIQVQLVTVFSREEAVALAALREQEPEQPRPPARGRVRLELVESITAGEYLQQHGITLPATEPQTQDA